MDLLEVSNRPQVRVSLEQVAVYVRFLPPVLMFLATSKGFIFLVMDIVIITLICRAGWAASTYHQYVDNTIRQYSANLASQSNPAFADSQADIVAQKQHNKQMDYIAATAAQDNNSTRTEATAPVDSPHRYNDTSRETNGQVFVYPDRTTNVRNEEKPRQDERQQQQGNQRPNSLALQSKLNERPVSQQQQNGNAKQYGSPDQYDDRKLENRLSHFTSSNGKEIRSVEPLKDETIPERQQQQQGRVRVLPIIAHLNRNSSDNRQRPPVPPKPHNPNRVSMQPAIVEERRHERPDSRNSGNKVDRTSSMNAPEELRGQLPWSYFKARDDVPKNSFIELAENEDVPAVPVPDYTLHFPKNKRPNLSDSDGENSWSRYEQRY